MCAHVMYVGACVCACVGLGSGEWWCVRWGMVNEHKQKNCTLLKNLLLHSYSSHFLPACLPSISSCTGMITIQGPAQNETHPSGETITLHCTLEGAGQGTDYVWTRESGDVLPLSSVISGGEKYGSTSSFAWVLLPDSTVLVRVS